MKKALPYFLLFSFCSLFSYSQKEASIWYFGRNAGLDFNTGSPPTPLLDGLLNTGEGCASIADASGNLLFYTDGITIWDKNHGVMATGLMGDPSSVQSAIITPYVGDPNRYYIFTTDGSSCDPIGPKGYWDGLMYTVVDMSINVGLGGIVPGFKNRSLVDSVREVVTAARHANGIDYWIITRENFTNNFYSFLVTCNGVDENNPVITSSGPIGNTNRGEGYLKASPASDALIHAFNGGYCQLHDFNNATGQLSNPRTISKSSDYYYGASFSPDGKVLYISGSLGGAKIFRYDRFAANIPNSEIIQPIPQIGSRTQALQQAPDGKMYFTWWNTPILGVIHDPNNFANPNIQYNYVPLGGRLGIWGLPNYFDALLFYQPPIAGRDTSICNGTSVQIGTPSVAGLNYFWSPATGLSNSAVSDPFASPTASTQYIMGAYNTCDTIYDTLFVTVSAGLNLTVNPPSATICNGNSVSLTASGANNYEWSPSQGLNNSTGSIVIVNPPFTTTYSVTGTDGSGCLGTSTVSITVSSNFSVTVNPPDTAICEGSSISLIASGANTYSWSPANGLSNTTGGMIFCAPSASTTYSVTGVDGSDCISTNTISVNILSLPSVSANPTNPDICLGDNITLTATGANTYSWSPASGLNNSTGDIVLVNPTTNTIYTVTGTDANGCSAVNMVSLIVSPLPSVMVNPPISNICVGNFTTLTATGANTYSWSPAIGLNSLTGDIISANPSNNTIYTITGMDGNGCIASNTISIMVSPVPSLTLSPKSVSMCEGKTTALVVSGANTYSWIPAIGINNTTGNTIIANPSASTTYSVIGTDGNGCTSSDSASIIIFPNPQIILNSSAAIICEGNSVGLTATGANFYSWVTSAGITLIAPGVVTTSPSSTTNYLVSGTDLNNCVSTETISITVLPKPTLTINSSNPTICKGGSTTLSAVGASTYSWSPGTGLSSTTGDLIVANPTNSTFYTITGTDVNGCVNTNTLSLTVSDPAVAINSANPIICYGNSLALSASGSNSYLWSPTIGLSSATGAIVSASPTTNTIYSVTGTNAAGCTAIQSVSITVNDLPVVQFTINDSNGCAPVCIDFTNTTLNSKSCTWNLGNGDVFNQCIFQYCYTTPGNYYPSLEVTDINGCSASATMINPIQIYAAPTALFNMDPSSATLLTSNIQFTDLSTGANVWQWSFGDAINSFSSLQHPQFNYQDTGSYMVQLIVSNQWNCMDTTLQLIDIKADFALYVPNTFTPNNDGINDIFKAQGIGIDIRNFEMFIYDRWGNLIFKTNDYSKGWNGIVNGGNKIAQQDVYVWKISTRDTFDTKHQYMGHVNLIK